MSINEQEARYYRLLPRLHSDLGNFRDTVGCLCAPRRSGLLVDTRSDPLLSRQSFTPVSRTPSLGYQLWWNKGMSKAIASCLVVSEL